MQFSPTRVIGAFIIDPDRRADERGFFARSWCRDEFAEHGLDPRLVQCNISFNHKTGTLRGMHYQHPPHAETKLVRCTAGAVFDVAMDIRRDSASFGKWVGVELTADNRRMLYIPEGCAHGYLTLADNCEVFYQVSASYAPDAADGVRWNDPAFDVEWPIEPSVMHPRDREYPDFAP